MRIGIDATSWFNTRGYGRQLRLLMNAVADLDKRNQYVLVFDSPVEFIDLPPGMSARFVQTSQRTVDAASAGSRRNLRDIWKMSRALSSTEFDIIFFPTVYSVVPVISRAMKILMIHDVIPERYPHLTLPSTKARWAWKIKSAVGRRQANAIITVSEYSRMRISETFRIKPEAISVVGEASAPVFRKSVSRKKGDLELLAGLPEDARIIVYVGGFGPHKNLRLLIECFARIIQDAAYSGLYLLMAGEDRHETFFTEIDVLRARIDELHITQKAIFTGYVSDEDLVQLYNQATLLVLPSLMEGFGLPAIEAAACGCPVVATGESAIPDVLGTAGKYFDPHNPAQLEQVLREVLSSDTVRQQMSEAGLKITSDITWETAAYQMLEVFEKISPM